MKKVFTFLLLAFIAISAAQVRAQEFEKYIGNTKLKLLINNDYEIIIRGFVNSSTQFSESFVIPEKITAPNGKKYKVTTIGEDARLSGGFASITIPRTVEYIGPNAFKYCPNLKTVYIKGSPQVNKNAFIQCTALEKVYITGRKEFGDSFPIANGGKAIICR